MHRRDLLPLAAFALVAGAAGIALAQSGGAPPQAIPPDQAEGPPPPSPGPRYVWEPGHWHWNGVAWVWRHGHWAIRQAGWHAFVRGAWVLRGGGWVWVPGHWE